MKSVLHPIVFFALMSLSTTHAQAQICASLAGTWSQNEGEVHETPTIIKIESSCAVKTVQVAERHKKECFSFEYLFKDGAKTRAQYGFNTGVIGTDGNPCPALPDDYKKDFQGNVIQEADGSIRFGLDFIDRDCPAGQCLGAKFYKRN